MATMNSDSPVEAGIFETIEELMYKAAFQKPMEFSMWRHRMAATSFLFPSYQEGAVILKSASASASASVEGGFSITPVVGNKSEKKRRHVIRLKLSSRSRDNVVRSETLKSTTHPLPTSGGKEEVLASTSVDLGSETLKSATLLTEPGLKRAPDNTAGGLKRAPDNTAGKDEVVNSKSVLLTNSDDHLASIRIATSSLGNKGINTLKRPRPVEHDNESKLEASRKKLQYRYQQALSNRKKIMVIDPPNKTMPPTKMQKLQSRQVFSHSRVISCV